MADRKYYVICEQNCKFESMTKEQILTAITQAVNEGTIGNIDTGFITTVKTINGKPLKFFVGSQSEYEALTDAEKDGLFAIITNDTSKEAFENALAVLQENYEALLDGLLDGSFVVSKAKRAEALETKAITIQQVSTSGVATEFIELGRAYMIAAEINGVSETFVIYLSTKGYDCYSTQSPKGHCAFVDIGSVNKLYFEDGGGTKISANWVYIREFLG